MRNIGLVVLYVDSNGNITTNTTDWLTDLLLQSPLLQRAVEENKQEWTQQGSLQYIEAFAGVWIAPVQLTQHYRNNGFGLGVFITNELCDGEYFHALCQASNADATMIRNLITSMNPIQAKEVARMATLFQMAWNASLQHDLSQHTVESVGQELADTYEEISLLYTMTGSMNSVNHPERFIELACNELLQTLQYEWIGVQLTTGDRLPNPGSTLVFASLQSDDIASYQEAVSALIGSVEAGKTQISNGNDALAQAFGPATLVEPILKDGGSCGRSHSSKQARNRHVQHLQWMLNY